LEQRQELLAVRLIDARREAHGVVRQHLEQLRAQGATVGQLQRLGLPLVQGELGLLQELVAVVGGERRLLQLRHVPDARVQAFLGVRRVEDQDLRRVRGGRRGFLRARRRLLLRRRALGASVGCGHQQAAEQRERARLPARHGGSPPPPTSSSFNHTTGVASSPTTKLAPSWVPKSMLSIATAGTVSDSTGAASGAGAALPRTGSTGRAARGAAGGALRAPSHTAAAAATASAPPATSPHAPILRPKRASRPPAPRWRSIRCSTASVKSGSC